LAHPVYTNQRIFTKIRCRLIVNHKFKINGFQTSRESVSYIFWTELITLYVYETLFVSCGSSLSFWRSFCRPIFLRGGLELFVWLYVAMKRQAWSTRSARNYTASERSAWLTEDGGKTRDSDVTSGASQTTRAHKQRQLAGTETEIMHQMLFSTATKQPLPSSQLNERERTTEDSKTKTKKIAASRAERKRVSSSRGNSVDVISKAKTRERTTGSDDESNASADTYTIDSDGKEELRQERARIDVAFGVVTDNTANDRLPPSTDNNDAQLLDAEVADEDEDVNECSLQIHKDSDAADQSPLKRTKNQTLYMEDNVSSSGVSKSDSPLDLNCSENSNQSLSDGTELGVVGQDSCVRLDQGVHQTKWTSSQSSVERLPSETDGLAVDNEVDSNAFARQNTATDAAGDHNTAAVDAEFKEPKIVKNSEAGASFRDDDYDDNDRSPPPDIFPLKTMEHYHEVKNTSDMLYQSYNSCNNYGWRYSCNISDKTLKCSYDIWSAWINASS